MQSRGNHTLRCAHSTSPVASGEVSKAAHEYCQGLRLRLRGVMKQLVVMLLMLIKILMMVL